MQDRTKVGRALLRVRQDVRLWLAANREKAAPDQIQAAELLICNLDSAAYNGLGGQKAHLLEAVDRMEAAPSGRRG